MFRLPKMKMERSRQDHESINEAMACVLGAMEPVLDKWEGAGVSDRDITSRAMTVATMFMAEIMAIAMVDVRDEKREERIQGGINVVIKHLPTMIKDNIKYLRDKRAEVMQMGESEH